MKTLLILVFMFILIGCAPNPAIVKPDATLTQTEIRNVNHFVTFRSEPSGAEVVVIDSKTGKEVQSFGKTPVRILIMSKKMEIDSSNGAVVRVTDPVANTLGLTYGQTFLEGVEFQLKYKLTGYYDELKILRLPIGSGDSEYNLPVKMIQIK